jgi:hypothetical protein
VLSHRWALARGWSTTVGGTEGGWRRVSCHDRRTAVSLAHGWGADILEREDRLLHETGQHVGAQPVEMIGIRATWTCRPHRRPVANPDGHARVLAVSRRVATIREGTSDP